MNISDLPWLETTVDDAARWRELIMLLNRKAYKTNITPEEIAAQLPDLREIHRSLRSPDASPVRSSPRR